MSSGMEDLKSALGGTAGSLAAEEWHRLAKQVTEQAVVSAAQQSQWGTAVAGKAIATPYTPGKPPPPPDTPLTLALLDAIRECVGRIALSAVDTIYLPRVLFFDAKVSVLRAASCQALATDDDDIVVVRMRDGATGVVRLPQAVLDLAVAQRVATTLTA